MIGVIMILFYKTKILISGIFPMINFKIDGFVEKTDLYNENMIDANNPDYIFYSSGHLFILVKKKKVIIMNILKMKSWLNAKLMKNFQKKKLKK